MIYKQSTYNPFLVIIDIFLFLFDVEHNFHWKCEQNLHSATSSVLKIYPKNAEKSDGYGKKMHLGWQKTTLQKY